MSRPISLDIHRMGERPDVIAPDGLGVHLLGGTDKASHAGFALAAGQTGRAIRHRTVDELWFVVAGEGELWRSFDDAEVVDHLEPGVALSLPVGTSFQARAGAEPLRVVAATIPPWPGDDEAIFTEGPWPPTVDRAD